MTDARVEKVYADRVGARGFLAQAKLLLADAREATAELFEWARALLSD